MSDKPLRGANFKKGALGKQTEEKTPITYLEFATKVTNGGGVINYYYNDLVEQIDGLMAAKHRKVRDMPASYDLARRFKNIAQTYSVKMDTEEDIKAHDLALMLAERAKNL